MELKDIIDVSQFTSEQLRILQGAISKNLDITKLLNPKYSNTQMLAYSIGLENGVDLTNSNIHEDLLSIENLHNVIEISKRGLDYNEYKNIDERKLQSVLFAIDNKVDYKDIIHEYNCDQLNQLIEARSKNYDTKHLENNKLSAEKMNSLIFYGLAKDTDISLVAKPEYSVDKIEYVLTMMNKGLDYDLNISDQKANNELFKLYQNTQKPLKERIKSIDKKKDSKETHNVFYVDKKYVKENPTKTIMKNGKNLVLANIKLPNKWENSNSLDKGYGWYVVLPSFLLKEVPGTNMLEVKIDKPKYDIKIMNSKDYKDYSTITVADSKLKQLAFNRLLDKEFKNIGKEK